MPAALSAPVENEPFITAEPCPRQPRDAPDSASSARPSAATPSTNVSTTDGVSCTSASSAAA